MVRFHWHVEDGYGAHIPPCGMIPHKDTKVMHALVEIELPDLKSNAEALMTVPPGYLGASDVKDVGIILAHGHDADGWRGKLLTEIAAELGKAGHVVLRYHCPAKELRRQRMLEKALDVAATSPFARNVTRWVLAGVGSGGRVAAAVAARCRAEVAGFMLLSYPLVDSTSKGSVSEAALQSLTKLSAPLLFIQPGRESADALRAKLDQLPAPDVRLMELPNVDSSFRNVSSDAGKATGPTPHTLRRVTTAVLDFVAAVNDKRLDLCRVQQLKGEPLAAGISTYGSAASERLEEQQAQQQAQQQQQQQHALLSAGSMGMGGGGGHSATAAAVAAVAAARSMQHDDEARLKMQRQQQQQLQQQRLMQMLGSAQGGGAGMQAAGGGIPGMAGLLQGLLQGQGQAGAGALAGALGLGGAGNMSFNAMQGGGMAGAGGLTQQQLLAMMASAPGKRPATGPPADSLLPKR